MRNLVLRKRTRDRDFVCTTFFVPEGDYVFTLEGCSDKIEAIFRNEKGEAIGVVTPGESIIITRRGRYLICLEGRDGLGSLWVEWKIPGSVGIVGELCCDELRELIENLQNQITNIINNLGEDCCDELRQEINNIKTQITNIINSIPNLIAGNNIEIVKEGRNYTISSTAIGDVTKQYVDNRINEVLNIINNLTDNDTIVTITAGENVSVVKDGNNYTISSTGGGGGGENAVIRSVDPNIIITER